MNEVNSYFRVIAKVDFEGENGKIKHTNEEYLISAVNVTDAETKLFKFYEDKGYTQDFKVISVRETKIITVI
jgi:hypothetical protein